MLGCQGLGHGGVPGGLRAAEGVAEDQQLAQAGGERDLGRFASGDEALVEGLDAGVVAGGRQGGHVERGGALDEVENATEAVEQAEFAADVKVGESGRTCTSQVMGESRFRLRRRTNGRGRVRSGRCGLRCWMGGLARIRSFSKELTYMSAHDAWSIR